MVKSWILPAGFALGALSAQRLSAAELLRGVVVWLILELLIYPARYQWNDIRGFDADQTHPDVIDRGRLPGPAERGRAHKRASAVVATARVIGGFALALALPTFGITILVALLTAAVFAIAILYEELKDRGTGQAAQIPSPLSPPVVGLWMVVGGGYAIRGVAGLALALNLTSRPLVAATAIVTMWAFGVAFVTSRWAIEALAFAAVEQGRVTWKVRPDQAREHLLALVRWLPLGSLEATAAGNRPRDWRPLRMTSPFGAPWNLAAIGASACAGLLGQLLVEHGDGASVALAATACTVAAALVLRAGPEGRPTVLLLAAAALTGIVVLGGTPRPAVALAPWLAVLGAQVFFCSQSLQTLGHPLRSLVASRGGRTVTTHA